MNVVCLQLNCRLSRLHSVVTSLPCWAQVISLVGSPKLPEVLLFLFLRGCAALMQFLRSWRAAGTSPISKWDACLVATINQLSTALDEYGPGCLSQPTLLALCCILAGHHTCTLWLMSLLARPAASGTKGKENLPLISRSVMLLKVHADNIRYMK